jgi:O-antigen ligase
MKSINEFIAASAVIIFPASVLVVDKVYGAVFLIVILLGIWQMVAYRKEIFPISKDEKLFFLSLCFVMVTVVITTVVNDTDMARADRFLALVLAIPAYYFFKRNLFDEKYIWIGVVLGAVVAGIIAYYQVFNLDYCPIKPVHAKGVVHEIIFGDLGLVMGVMSLVGVGWFKTQKVWLVMIPLIALSAGMLASALSLTRGGWVAVPFILLLFAWYTPKGFTLRVRILIFSISFFVLCGLYLIPQTGVQNRVEAAYSQINMYILSDNVNDKARQTSLGIRFELWRAANFMFKENLVVGGGWGEFSGKVHLLIDEGLINKTAVNYYHPHNQFISALAKGGLLGFGSILIFFILPAFVFCKSISRHSEAEVQRMAFAGLVLILSFFIFSLSESILERSRSIIFVSFYLAVIMAILQTNISNTRKKRDLVSSEIFDGLEDQLPVNSTCEKTENLVLLENDVYKVFKDSNSVNRVLRLLIDIAEKNARKS